MAYAPLVVLGMHRSGTSLATSLLAGAGLDVGQRLLGAHASNPRGHFEDEDFLEFDRLVLRQVGADSDGWVVAPLPSPPTEWVSRARALVERKRASGRPWGWKDPRTVPLLPLWRAAAPDATFVIVYRKPWEVVDSLFRRGDAAFNADAELAVHVWQHYNDLLLALVRSAPERCLVSNIDAIAADPAAWVRAVAEHAGVPLAQPGDGVVDPSLRHGARALVFADVLRQWYPGVIETFEALERIASRRGELDVPSSRARVEAPAGGARRAMETWRDAVVPPPSPGTAAVDQGGAPLRGTWLLGTNADGVVAVLMRSADDAAFSVAIERAGTANLWDIQLRRPGVPLEAGVTYEMAFRARASADRRVAFGVNTRDYRSIGLYEEVTLSVAWQELRATFVAAESDDAGELHFDVGASTASVDLADVMLRRLPDGAVIAGVRDRR